LAIGKPIDVRRNFLPSGASETDPADVPQAALDAAHTAVGKAMKALFDEYKNEYADMLLAQGHDEVVAAKWRTKQLLFESEVATKSKS
jgi:hypothetical protein